MNEPMTVLTDYALAGVAGTFAYRLRKIAPLWALGLAALALAALAGGTWHGWFWHSDPLWKATVLLAGVANFGMLAGSARATTQGSVSSALVAFAALKLAVYAAWMLRHDEFIWVVADTAVALALVAALYFWRFSGWMLAGVAVSVLAGLAQASGLRLHAHFNHNDLYHLIQIGALFAFYRGLKEG